MNNILFIIRNRDFTDRGENTSILGCFSSLVLGWKSARRKIKDLQSKNIKVPHMEIKAVKLNFSDYAGCSAFQIDFMDDTLTEDHVKEVEEKIINWGGWKSITSVNNEESFTNYQE